MTLSYEDSRPGGLLLLVRSRIEGCTSQAQGPAGGAGLTAAVWDLLLALQEKFQNGKMQD